MKRYSLLLTVLIISFLYSNNTFGQGSNNTPCDAIDLNAEPCQNIDQIPSLIYASSMCGTKDNVFYKYTMNADKSSLDIICDNDSSNAFLIHVYELLDSCSGELILLDEFGLIGTRSDTLRSFGLEKDKTYYIGIIKQSLKSNLSFCVQEHAVTNGCAPNFYPRAATAISNLTPGTKTCINGCNKDMTTRQTHINGNYTFETNSPTAWYKISTVGFNWVRLEVSSTQMRNPAVSIYTSCDSIIAINAYEMTLEPNRTYYIGVYDLLGGSGDFKLCITPVNSKNECLIQYPLAVTRTSMGSPLSGPYQPCETVTMEYRVFTLPNNFLEWAHSIMPVYSPCFNHDPTQEPQHAIIPPSSDTFQWNWELPGTVFWKPVSTQDMNVGIDTTTGALCYLSEPGCKPLVGGGDCSTSGDAMPGAWVVRTFSPICNSDLPNYSWGYNRNNQAVFTFEVQIPCDAASNPCNDYWVRVISFTDGQTGGWTYMGCTGQMFSTKRLDVVSCIPPELTVSNDTICSSITFDKDFNLSDSIAYVSWTADSLARSMGAQDGSGGNMTQHLVNTSDAPVVAGFTLIPVGTDSCIGNAVSYSILVNPQVTVNAGGTIIACQDSVRLNGESNGYVTWSTQGDGIFSYIHDKKATYHLGAGDKLNKSVYLIMSAEKSNNPPGCQTASDTLHIVFGEIELGYEIPFDSCETNVCIKILQGSGDTYTYTWEDGSHGRCVVPGPDQDAFAVTVSNSSGCSKEYSFGINEFPIRWQYTYQSFSSANDVATGSINMVFTGNIPVKFVWKNEAGDIVGDSIGLVNVFGGNYYLEVTDKAGCTLTIGPIKVDQEVSNKHSLESAYLIYPNPASGQVFIHTQNGNPIPDKIKAINAMGVSEILEVNHINADIGSVNCRRLAPGFYTFRMESNGSLSNEKVLIMR
jgi:hypothetical protein